MISFNLTKIILTFMLDGPLLAFLPFFGGKLKRVKNHYVKKGLVHK